MKQHDEQHRLRTCLWIINAFQRRGKMTLRELNELWVEDELSRGEEIIPRTFYNYRTAIQDLFSIVFECDKRTNSYYIDCRDDDNTTEWLLSSFSVGQLLSKNKEISDRILLENIPSGQQHLSTIIEAMHGNNVIEISYQAFVEDEAHCVCLEPYCTKLFHQRWYVVANNIERGHLQTYALDRILGIKILGKTFTPNPDFDARAYFHYSFGIFASDHQPPQKIQIKVEASQCKYLRTLPLHHSQKEISTNERYSIFQFELVPTQDFIIELMSHGASFEVLAPQSLRQEIKNTVNKMAEMYK